MGHVFIVSATVHANLGVFRASSNNILVWIILPGPQLGVEDGGDCKGCRQEPDHGDVESVGPGAHYVIRKVPFTVFSEEVVGQEENSQRQEKQETVIEISEIKRILNLVLNVFITSLLLNFGHIKMS